MSDCVAGRQGQLTTLDKLVIVSSVELNHVLIALHLVVITGVELNHVLITLLVVITSVELDHVFVTLLGSRDKNVGRGHSSMGCSVG